MRHVPSLARQASILFPSNCAYHNFKSCTSGLNNPSYASNTSHLELDGALRSVCQDKRPARATIRQKTKQIPANQSPHTK